MLQGFRTDPIERGSNQSSQRFNRFNVMVIYATSTVAALVPWKLHPCFQRWLKCSRQPFGLWFFCPAVRDSCGILFGFPLSAHSPSEIKAASIVHWIGVGEKHLKSPPGQLNSVGLSWYYLMPPCWHQIWYRFKEKEKEEEDEREVKDEEKKMSILFRVLSLVFPAGSMLVCLTHKLRLAASPFSHF